MYWSRKTWGHRSHFPTKPAKKVVCMQLRGRTNFRHDSDGFIWYFDVLYRKTKRRKVSMWCTNKTTENRMSPGIYRIVPRISRTFFDHFSPRNPGCGLYAGAAYTRGLRTKLVRLHIASYSYGYLSSSFEQHLKSYFSWNKLTYRYLI